MGDDHGVEPACAFFAVAREEREAVELAEGIEAQEVLDFAEAGIGGLGFVIIKCLGGCGQLVLAVGDGEFERDKCLGRLEEVSGAADVGAPGLAAGVAIENPMAVMGRMESAAKPLPVDSRNVTSVRPASRPLGFSTRMRK